MRNAFCILFCLSFSVMLNGQIEGIWFDKEGAQFKFTKIQDKPNFFRMNALATSGIAKFDPKTNQLIFKAETPVGEYIGGLNKVGPNLIGAARWMGIKIDMYLSRVPIPKPEIPGFPNGK